MDGKSVAEGQARSAPVCRRSSISACVSRDSVSELGPVDATSPLRPPRVGEQPVLTGDAVRPRILADR